MKRFSALLILSLFIISACMENPLVEPGAESNVGINETQAEYQWLDMPMMSKNQRLVQTEVSDSKWILGSDGGTVTVSYVVDDGPFGKFKMISSLRVPPHAFPDEEEMLFVVTLDDETTTVTFQPHPYTFFIPLQLNLTYTGIDLSFINPDEIKFAYIAPDGSIELAECDKITVDLDKGEISVKKAVIPHFSRFGFVR